MDVPVSKSGLLSGLLEYLGSKLGVRDISLNEGPPASHSQLVAWEEASECSLPQDLKDFYLTNNGLSFTWNYQYNGKVLRLGRLNINKIQELLLLGGLAQPVLFSHGGSVTSAEQPSLSDLDITSESDGPWRPSFSGCCKIFTLDYCTSCGHVCLVYNMKEEDSGGELWLLDLSLCWHHLSTTFSDYIRLVVVHLALLQWPLALTTHGPSPQWEHWFRMFIPHRLETDLSVSSPDNSKDTSSMLSVVDISRIVIVKPNKEKRSKVENKTHVSERRT